MPASMKLWNIQWLAENADRKYPLADDADGISDSGDFNLPDDFIVELDLAVHYGQNVAPGNFFIKHIGAYATGYSVIVGYQPDDGDAVDVATALIARQLHTRNRVYALGGVGDFSDAVGKVVIGRLDSIDNQPPGFHSFLRDHGRLDPDAVRPVVRGVAALYVVNNGVRSSPLYGDVELVAGPNIRLTPSTAGGMNTVMISAISGEGLVEDCACDGDESTGPVKTILGIPPDANGNFVLAGDDCIEISPVANGLQLTDRCSKPCCGCADLEAITRDLERLRSEAAAVEDFNDRLRVSVDTMSMVVLGSRLGDRGCFTE